jgi:hypothetical protein
MDLTEFISISGQGGLFKVIARAKNGLIVESLADKRRQPVHSSQKVSALQDISVFTNDEDVPLSEVFTTIFEKEKGGPAIDSKANPEDLKKYFSAVLPDYDQERVYVSDMKKIITWYNTLQAQNLLKPAEKEESKAAEGSEEKSKAKGKSGKKEEAEASSEKEEKPKKTAAKTTAKAKTAAKSSSSKSVDKAPKASKAKAPSKTVTRKTGA